MLPVDKSIKMWYRPGTRRRGTGQTRPGLSRVHHEDQRGQVPRAAQPAPILPNSAFNRRVPTGALIREERKYQSRPESFTASS